MKRLLGQFGQAVEASTASCEDEPRGYERKNAFALQVVVNQRQKFLRAGLNDFAEHPRKDGSPRTVADACNFDGHVLAEECRSRAAVMLLDSFGFRNGRAETDSKVVGEMIAPHTYCARVADHAAAVNDKLGGATSDIEQAAAQVALVLQETGFR